MLLHLRPRSKKQAETSPVMSLQHLQSKRQITVRLYITMLFCNKKHASHQIIKVHYIYETTFILQQYHNIITKYQSVKEIGLL